MSEPSQRFPRKILIAAAALALFTISAAAMARWSGLGSVKDPQAATNEVRELRFEDRTDGAVAVYQAADGHLVDVLAPGTSGFVRIVMRSLARERRLNDQDRTTPFRLIRWADGRLTVEDPTTRRVIDLGAFGDVNTQAFARLMSGGARNPMTPHSQSTLQVPCTIEIEHTHESLHAHVDLEGINIGPGDRVFVHGAPTSVPFGERLTLNCRATIVRAGPLGRLKAHIEGYLELTELYEVSFSGRRMV